MPSSGRTRTGGSWSSRTDGDSPCGRSGSVSRIADAPDKLVYLITGSDRPKVEKAVARLRLHFDPGSIEHVSALDHAGDAVAALCNMGSLLGDMRLVLVTEVDGTRGDRGRKGGWKAVDVDAVVEYLKSPAPGTVLTLVAEELKQSSALWKACDKAGSVLQFDVEKKKLHDWVANQFRQRRVRAEPDATAALVQLVGDDLHALAIEVDKIATWANGEPVGEREVEALVAASAETPIYELAEAWSMRDSARALEVSESLFERDSKPRRDVAPRLAGSLASHLNRLRELKRLAAEGVPAKDAAERLKLHPFRARKLYAQAEAFSGEELDDAVIRIAQLDGALKGQSRLQPDLELQRTLAALTHGPGEPPPVSR